MSSTVDHANPASLDASTDEEIAGFADRIFGVYVGALDTLAIALGDELGWYAALAGAASMTSGELAESTNSDERYAREWLEHQTVAGYVQVDDARLPATERRYTLPPAHAAVLADRDSLAYMTPFAQAVGAFAANLGPLAEAYRNGTGVGWHQHGDAARCGQAAANRPLFLRQLGHEFLASLDDVHDVLSTGGRVADIGCGLGWSSIGIAQAYPAVTVDGFDIDAPSIAMAEANARDAGVDDRVRFLATDAAAVEGSTYDLAIACECVHDMPDPVSVLATMRSMVGDDGAVIVMDERVGDHFTGDPDPVEQLLYGFSLMCCLPDGCDAPESVATGTVMRLPTFERYASAAGFSSVEVLPIDHDLFRFYRLRT